MINTTHDGICSYIEIVLLKLYEAERSRKNTRNVSEEIE